MSHSVVEFIAEACRCRQVTQCGTTVIDRPLWITVLRATTKTSRHEALTLWAKLRVNAVSTENSI